MNLSTLINKVDYHLRLSPVYSDSDIVDYLRQAILEVDTTALWLENIGFITCKEDEDCYLLPGDHVATTSAYYDNVRLQPCNSFDAQLASPSAPIYYYEDDWQNEASDAAAGEFLKQYALCELWPLQLMHSQNSYGRKTITLVVAPTSDGTASTYGIQPYGTLDGDVTDSYIYYPSTVGDPIGVASSDGNLVVFYKCTGELPYDVNDDLHWSEGMATIYAFKAASLALRAETDEGDRYRSWLYGFVADSLCGLLRGMAINKRAL